MRAGRADISATHVWQLRTSLRDNPTRLYLEALADSFGVPAAYFLDDKAASRLEADLALRRSALATMGCAALP